MSKSKNVLRKILILSLGLILLVGCGNKMFDQATDQGRLAVSNQEYQKAKASFELALEEKDSDEVRSMLSEVESFLAGMEAQEKGDLDEALDYFNEIIEGDHALPSIVQEAKEWTFELEEIKDQQKTYNEQLVEARSLLEEADYNSSKEILNQLLEEISEEEYFEEIAKEAKDMLEEANLGIEEEKEKEKDEARRREEEAQKQRAAEEKKKDMSEIDRVFEMAKEAFGTDALAYDELYYNGELYYHFHTTNHPRVQGILGSDGTMYDAYTYNLEGILVEP